MAKKTSENTANGVASSDTLNEQPSAVQQAIAEKKAAIAAQRAELRKLEGKPEVTTRARTAAVKTLETVESKQAQGPTDIRAMEYFGGLVRARTAVGQTESAAIEAVVDLFDKWIRHEMVETISLRRKPAGSKKSATTEESADDPEAVALFN